MSEVRLERGRLVEEEPSVTEESEEVESEGR